MNLQAINRFAEIKSKTSGPQTTKCVFIINDNTCNRQTFAGKSYCLKHIENSPYIQNIIKQLKEKKNEEAQVNIKGTKAIGKNSLTIREILSSLIGGGRPISTLSKDLHLKQDILKIYIKYLKSKKRVIVNNEIIKLPLPASFKN